jgi:hypothetical protein
MVDQKNQEEMRQARLRMIARKAEEKKENQEEQKKQSSA